jgi:hypothetical protein
MGPKSPMKPSTSCRSSIETPKSQKGAPGMANKSLGTPFVMQICCRDQFFRYLLKKSMVRCQASLAEASSLIAGSPNIAGGRIVVEAVIRAVVNENAVNDVVRLERVLISWPAAGNARVERAVVQ